MLREGELVWARIAFRDRDGNLAAKERPALVLRVLPDGVVVAWGTGTAREPCVTVEPGHRWGRAWELSKTTYFHERNVAKVAVAEVRQLSATGRMSDPLLGIAIREVVSAELARFPGDT